MQSSKLHCWLNMWKGYYFLQKGKQKIHGTFSLKTKVRGSPPPHEWNRSA